MGTRVQVADGSKVYEKQIYREPTKYFTDEVMKKIDAAVAKEFCYGSANVTVEEEMENNDD